MMRLSVLLGLLAATGCGYHLAGTGTTVPATARTIKIDLFVNHTREHGLEVQVRRAIEDEFLRQGQLRVVGSGDGDLVLSGDIRRFTSIPVATSAITDEAVQYATTILLSVRLTEHGSGRVLFENKLLQETSQYGAVSSVVISSSPRFQRGTINSRDLADLTNVQVSETRRRQAASDLIDTLAHDVYQQSMEGF
jgi:hypothetical protein